MVGVEIVDDNGNSIEHWVPLEKFNKKGDMQVRDPLTTRQYKNRERNGTSQYKDRYTQTYSVSDIKCILYHK